MPSGKKWSWEEDEIRKYVGELKGVTVPVHISIEGRQRILSFGQVEKLLREAITIALGECECRERVQACDSPRDVCLYIGQAADEQIQRGLGTKVGLGEALSALKRSSDAGLVLVTYTDREKDSPGPHYICSCCSCCCHSMIALEKYGFNEAIVTSDFIAEQDQSLCNDCGACTGRCQFKARKMVDSHLSYNSKACFGCGLCVGSCPENAISLQKRVR